MRLAEKADSKKTTDWMNIPEELSRRQDRLTVIAEAKEKIDQRAAERYAQEKQEYETKVVIREAKVEKLAKTSWS